MNSTAEAFGQAATQAPQPMHAAASIARSASCFRHRMALASGALPVRTEMKPPAAMMRSKALRSTTRSLIDREGAGAPRLEIELVAVLEVRMWSWQTWCSWPGRAGCR